MRLNLACGDDVREGYLNVDFRQTRPQVMLVDLSKLPWPFDDGSAEEILMLDALEHFPYAQTQGILLECFRILAPGGRVTFQVPDADHTMRAMTQRGEYLCNRCGGQIHNNRFESAKDRCDGCGQTTDEISETAMRRFYGGQNYPGNWHQTCFTRRSLDLKARQAGLRPVDVPVDEGHYFRNWTLIRTYERGELW